MESKLIVYNNDKELFTFIQDMSENPNCFKFPERWIKQGLKTIKKCNLQESDKPFIVLPNYDKHFLKDKYCWDDENIPIPQYGIIEKNVVIITDGSAIKNGNANCSAGFSVIYGYGPEKLINKILYGKLKTESYFNKVKNELEQFAPTSIRAEGFAILHGMIDLYFKIYVDKKKIYDIKNLYIVTDSEFWINMITGFIPKWIKESPNKLMLQKNPDLTTKIWKIYNVLSKIVNINFIHVNSHTDIENSVNEYERFNKFYNNVADKTAGIAKNLNDYELYSCDNKFKFEFEKKIIW